MHTEYRLTLEKERCLYAKKHDERGNIRGILQLRKLTCEKRQDGQNIAAEGRMLQQSSLPHPKPKGHTVCCFSGIYSLSLVGRGFFSFVSVFFSLVLSNLAISVRSGLSDMLAVNRLSIVHFTGNQKAFELLIFQSSIFIMLVGIIQVNN